MLKNYLKTALRHLRQNKGFSLLNMFGLSLGLACAILILLWIEDEISYNRFHEKYNSIYQVLENQTYDGKTFTFGATPGLLSAGMKNDFPEVKAASRMGWGDRWLFKSGDKPIYENGNYADPSFFDIFSFGFIYGDPKNAVSDEHSIVITQRMSEKFFGRENPVGKYLHVNDASDFKVSAVISDPPVNSTLQFDWLVSFKVFEARNPWWNSWTNNGMQTFVDLKEGTDVAKFNQKFSGYIKLKGYSESSEATARPFIFPMRDWRLRSEFDNGKPAGGRIEYVRLFGIVALLLVLIACINFMNLATARSEQRAREVGVRKVMGARRNALMRQFLTESMIMSLAATIVACGLVLISLPFFNELVGKQLTLGAADPWQWLIFIGIAVVCGLLAGSYPALYLSSFSPASIFKGFRAGGSSRTVLIRKGLVVIQFVISIVLIVSTVVIYKQIGFVKSRQLGFNKDHLLYVTQQGKINERLDVIREDLLATGMVSHMASCNQRIIQAGNNTGGFSWEGKDPSKDVLITTEYVSPDYVNTAGMKLSGGRDFYPDAVRDSMNVIINETLAHILGKGDPLNKTIRQGEIKYTVVGIVKDFVYNDMYRKPEPFIMFCQPRATNYVFMRIKENADTEKAMAQIESVFKKDNPNYPFEFRFLDEEFDKLFKSEMLISKLSQLFAILTVIISALGLFGLAAYTAERRTKEIGIRKVLGATVTSVVSLLSKDFVKLVLIAMVIATPVAWYVMNSWLRDYAYRISIEWWMFAGAGSLAVLIAIFTVSFQAIKAALSNPVKSLRTE